VKERRGSLYRTAQAHWGYKYLQGLLRPGMEQKTIQPMALALEGGNVQAMQPFIGQGRWQDERLLHKHWQLVDETLGEEEGVCIFDDSAFPKRGEHSVGMARQGCNTLGKVENSCRAPPAARPCSARRQTPRRPVRPHSPTERPRAAGRAAATRAPPRSP